jgi:hypothetical protein
MTSRHRVPSNYVNVKDFFESRKIKIDIAYDENATQLPAQYVTVTGRDLTVLFVQHA